MGFPAAVCFIALFVCSARASDAIVAFPPVVTNATQALLTCNFTGSSPVLSHYWTKNGKILEHTKADSNDVYTQLRLEKIEPQTGGIYTCVFNTGTEISRAIEVKTPPHVAAHKHSEHGNEGDKIVLVCVSHGYPLPTDWAWYRIKDKTEAILNGTGSFEINSTPNKTMLTIQQLTMGKDCGEYVCSATNELGMASDKINVRVRSRLAALWPFLGIVVEVIVLVSIIFIYEKRRKPDEISDGAAPLKGEAATNHTDKNVRQRNSN